MTSKAHRKIKPILYPQAFLEMKIQRKWSPSDITSRSRWSTPDSASKSICLMKYFPKYYKSLKIDGYSLGRDVQSRIKRLKIVKKFSSNVYYHCDYNAGHQRTFRRLYRGFRKTLKSIPDYIGWQDLRWCMDFPRVKTIKLPWGNFSQQRHAQDYGNIFDFWRNLELIKETKRLCGYFWSGNRFVENLRVECRSYSHLIIVKKLNDSKRFLSSLKILELSVGLWMQEASDLLIQLMNNSNFLEHVTHLKIENIPGVSLHWKLIQSLINCCPQLSLLSLDCQYDTPQDNLNQNLNLGCLENLQVLIMKGLDFEILSERIDFSSSIREVTLILDDFLSSKKWKRILGCQNFSEDAETEEQDRENWKDFEGYKVLDSFFEKWQKLENLKVLNLELKVCSRMDFLMKMLILPLLREKSQLETFGCQFYVVAGLSEEDGFFDLDFFFQGTKSLRSLKNLSLAFAHGHFIYNPQNPLFLPNLSSLDLSGSGWWSSPKFDISQFLKGIFHNLKSQPRNEGTSIKLSAIRLHSAQELIKLLNLLNKASQFKMLKIEIEVELYVENIDEIISNFRYPIYVPSNTELKVYLFEPNLDLTESSELTELTKKKKLNLREGPFEFPQIQSFFKQGYEI